MSIEVKDLTYTYPDGHVGLKESSLSIPAGKKTAILGLNGSGKSTLLRHFNGMSLPQEGSVTINGLEVNKKNLDQVRLKVGFLFDYPDHQLFSTTAYKDIAFGLDNYGIEGQEREDRIQKAADLFDIEDLLDRVPHMLSLGQKKKVATAGLMVLEPEVIVGDEPFSGLDSLGLAYFKGVLDDWVAQGRTLVFSTHDTDLTYEWADQVIILREGQVILSGPTDEVMTREEVYKETGLAQPRLFSLFKDSGTFPRSLEEAKIKLKTGE